LRRIAPSLRLHHEDGRDHKDITLAELQGRLARRGARFGISTLWRFFDRHGIGQKRRRTHPAEQQRPDVLRRREAWFENQAELEPERLVFIDETGVGTKTARLRGRSCGEIGKKASSSGIETLGSRGSELPRPTVRI